MNELENYERQIAKLDSGKTQEKHNEMVEVYRELYKEEGRAFNDTEAPWRYEL